ncbi:hypothetical protein [Pseudomonas sp. MWU13-3659]|uniref:hypothetical protein n=1 Tax=Pseudomonas sp. MWU13-3659 TaxID=2986964 RepID=UPI0020756665|nr:hypothetical protein [Pseudomonas sp. MWU13-3659]
MSGIFTEFRKLFTCCVRPDTEPAISTQTTSKENERVSHRQETVKTGLLSRLFVRLISVFQGGHKDAGTASEPISKSSADDLQKRKIAEEMIVEVALKNTAFITAYFKNVKPEDFAAEFRTQVEIDSAFRKAGLVITSLAKLSDPIMLDAGQRQTSLYEEVLAELNGANIGYGFTFGGSKGFVGKVEGVEPLGEEYAGTDKYEMAKRVIEASAVLAEEAQDFLTGKDYGAGKPTREFCKRLVKVLSALDPTSQPAAVAGSEQQEEVVNGETPPTVVPEGSNQDDLLPDTRTLPDFPEIAQKPSGNTLKGCVTEEVGAKEHVEAPLSPRKLLELVDFRVGSDSPTISEFEKKVKELQQEGSAFQKFFSFLEATSESGNGPQRAAADIALNYCAPKQHGISMAKIFGKEKSEPMILRGAPALAMFINLGKRCWEAVVSLEAANSGTNPRK